MNFKDVAIFAGVAIAAYLLLMRKGGKSAWTSEIENKALPGQIGYGWRYFSDGTAISPEGVYYNKGAQITAAYDGVSVGQNYGRLTT